MLASTFGTGEFLWDLLWFTLFFIWIWLFIVVVADVFRSHDLGGFAKALWVIFVIVMPILGVLVYLIARGHKISEHAMANAKAQDAAMRAYVQQAASTGGPAAELETLAGLRDRGAITEEEFQAQKAKVLGS